MTLINEVFKHSLVVFALNIGVILIGVLVLRLVGNKAFQRLAQKGKIREGQILIAKKIFQTTLYIFAIFAIVREVPALSTIATSFLAGSGLVAVVVGFASQEALTNIVSGAFIIFFKPFTINDRISLPDKNIVGFVEDISLRHTVIRTIENSRVIIPNSTINSSILENSNYKDNRRMNLFGVNVSYTANLDHVLALVEEEISKHPNFLDTRTSLDIAKGTKPVIARVTSLGDSSVQIRAGVWSEDFSKGYVMLCDLNKSVKERFDREGIEIPYPYHNLVLKSEGVHSLRQEN
jgi:small-conductance mechanosensitive channel